MKRLVVKLGTQTVLDPSGFLKDAKLGAIARTASSFLKQGGELILVSSGAIGLGKNVLSLKTNLSIEEKQAAAAVGQARLVTAYDRHFQSHGIHTAQVLVTASDFSNRRKYIYLSHTFETLLKLGVVPIVNENDSVSIAELLEDHQTESFGDNDILSALVASKLNADALFMLTLSGGLYLTDPKTHPEAKPLDVIDSLDKLNRIQGTSMSALGRGGIKTKLEAAKICAMSGIPVFIGPGDPDDCLAIALKAYRNQDLSVGTRVLPVSKLKRRQSWIAYGSGSQGVIVIDNGAKAALMRKRASLLAAGITGVKGKFEPDQVISIQDEEGNEIARGLVGYSSSELDQIKGKQSSETRKNTEVIHRDNLVLLVEIDK